MNMMHTQKLDTLFEKISFWVLLLTIVLAIVAFLPATIYPISGVKAIIIVSGVSLSLVCYGLSLLIKKNVPLPFGETNNTVLWTSIAVLISVLLSSIVSASPRSSFLGDAFESTTGGFIFLLFAVAFLSVFLIGSVEDVSEKKKRSLAVYMALMVSFTLVGLFHLVRLFAGQGFLAFNFFSSQTVTTLGSWYDLGAFAGIVFIISSLALYFLPLPKKYSILSLIFAVSSFLGLIIVDSAVVWFSIGLAAVVSTGYSALAVWNNRINSGKRSVRQFEGPARFAVIVIAAPIFFIFSVFGHTITDSLNTKLGTTYSEVALPWQYTLSITSQTIENSPFLGVGPNRFVYQYLKFKPAIINQTNFWSVNFQNGVSYLSNVIATQGMLGLIVWVLFLAALVRSAKETILRFSRENEQTDVFTQYVTLSSLIITGFLWTFTLLYVPSHTILFLTFVFTGLFLSHTVSTSVYKNGRITQIAIALIVLFSISWGVFYVKKTVAYAYFLNANRIVATGGDISKAVNNLHIALAWDTSDAYYQGLVQVNMYQISALIPQLSTGNTDPALVTKIGTLVSDGLNYARAAQHLDPANVSNYLAEAYITGIASNLKIPAAYETARHAYVNALTLDPYDPSIYLAAARLEGAQGSTTEAVSDLSIALRLKPDYTDALFEGGAMAYNGKDYQTASNLFTKVLTVDPTYSTAAYYLGLSYAHLGMTDAAIQVFTALAKAFPDNKDIQSTLTSLKAGTTPPAPSIREQQPTPSKVKTKTTR